MRSRSRLTSSRSAAGTLSHLLTPTTSARPASRMKPARCASCSVMPCCGVEQQHDDVGVLDRLQRLDHRELLDGLEHLAAAAHAGGVDQRVTAPVALEVEVDRVARRAGLVERDHALLAEQRVDERRLADVRAADDGDLDGVVLAVAPRRVVGGRRALREYAERDLDQRVDVVAMRRGNRVAARPVPARRIRATTLAGGMPSALLTASTTGRPERRSRSEISRSCGASPLRASTRKTTTSASAIAARVCFAISCRMPSLATGSKPPVSTTMNERSPRRAQP